MRTKSERAKVDVEKIVQARLQEMRNAAAVRAVRREATIQGMGSAFLAALGFIDAGDIDAARAICSAGHMAHITNLRERVSREPGGIAYEAEKAALSESDPR